jgi:hypothetical protein
VMSWKISTYTQSKWRPKEDGRIPAIDLDVEERLCSGYARHSLLQRFY